MVFFKQVNQTIIYESDGELLQLEAWGANSIRVRSVMQGEILDTQFALNKKPQPDTSSIEVLDDEAVLTNGKIQVRIKIRDKKDHNGTLAYMTFIRTSDGKILLDEKKEGISLNMTPRQFTGIPGGDFKLDVSFASTSKEKLFGMGQYQQDELDLKYTTLELAHRNSQASIPFVLSSLGYGFLWNNPAIGQVTFCRNVTRWHAESTKQMDYWITAGDTPQEIESTYLKTVGGVPMMPEYGLGYWQCKLRYWNQEQLLKVARTYHEKGIPLDVIVVDFFHWPNMGDFRFEDEFFPDPEAMARELKEMGIELMVSIWPCIETGSENFEEMRQKGLLVRTERGIQVTQRFRHDSVFYDTTNPKARQFVWDTCKKNYYDKGVRLFWLDESEPEYDAYNFDNYRYYLGSALQISNIYPRYYSKNFYDGMKEAGQDQIVNLVRCAWCGSAQYGALLWSGDIRSDWDTFRKQVVAGLNAGIAGIPWWTTDIGGFFDGDPKDPKFQELLIRWFEWGTFCPVMRMHGDRICEDRRVLHKDGTEALYTGADNEVWSYGEENEKIMTRYIFLREAMRDYTRQVMKDTHENCNPVMRPMFYDFPDQEICWDLTDQYMFGPDLLVAPVMEPDQQSRTVYLPEDCDWIQLQTGEVLKGGQYAEINASIGEIPVLIRQGSEQEKLVDAWKKICREH